MPGALGVPGAAGRIRPLGVEAVSKRSFHTPSVETGSRAFTGDHRSPADGDLAGIAAT